MSRTIFVGDIHGCLSEFKDLLVKLQVQDRDRIILLGDLINKGPYSVEVLKYVFKKNFECVLGNHDLKYRKQNETNDVYMNMRKEIGEEIHHWYMSIPLFIEGSNFIAVHGGMTSYHDLLEYDIEKVVRIREIEGRPWHDFYKEEKLVLYGHWAKQGLHTTSNTMCLDSGCVYGGKLTAYILESKTYVYVDAYRMYELIENE